MRLRLSLAAGGASLQVPVQYNHLLQGLVYHNLDRALSRWLHEEGQSVPIGLDLPTMRLIVPVER